MKTAKEKLTHILNGKQNMGINLKKLNDYFGENNIKRLPFSIIKIDLGSNPSDGNHVLEINLLSGKAEHYCTIADLDKYKLISDIDLIKIEQFIFNELNK